MRPCMACGGTGEVAVDTDAKGNEVRGACTDCNGSGSELSVGMR